tara:strand:+ start:613 stop:1296 length:684 start_codon:yes stop_codon:yes gene_type:complete
MTKLATNLQKMLEIYHSDDLQPIVDHVLEHLTNPLSRHRIILNHTERGMGYELQPPNTKRYIVRGDGELGVYQIYIDDIPYYTGEGIINVRLGRFVKALLGEQREDENHKPGEYIYDSIQKGKLKPEILERFYVSFLEFSKIRAWYESIKLEHESPLEGTINTKQLIEQYSRQRKGFDMYKPMTYYIEKIVMNQLGSIMNTNNQIISDLKYTNEQRFRKKSFVSKTY